MNNPKMRLVIAWPLVWAGPVGAGSAVAATGAVPGAPHFRQKFSPSFTTLPQVVQNVLKHSSRCPFLPSRRTKIFSNHTLRYTLRQ